VDLERASARASGNVPVIELHSITEGKPSLAARLSAERLGSGAGGAVGLRRQTLQNRVRVVGGGGGVTDRDLLLQGTVLQCVAVSCSVLQCRARVGGGGGVTDRDLLLQGTIRQDMCVAVCCSELQ